MGHICSMTGFGHGEASADSRHVTVEIKSVNHRYLDLSVKMPKRLNPFEAELRSAVKERVSRGKADLYVSVEDLSASASNITYNSTAAHRYMDIFRQMSDEFGLPMDVSLETLIRCPDVISASSADDSDDELHDLLMKALREALDSFIAQREAEGARLAEDLLGKLDGMSSDVDFIVSRSPEIIERYRAGLAAKIAETVADRNIDESRVLTEAAIYADRICVDEEMVRLKSHISAMREALTKGGNVGRSLDFIAQEMNREVNTTLSKSSDIEVTERGVRLKNEVEKIREQIQNIE